MTAYYNEIDPKAAAWLRELIRCGHIAYGHVDERSIEDVFPTDLAGFRQCHFFAGIGGWSLALRLAGVPDDYPVWTGSCPCQPFSQAGKGEGFADERHLWPGFFHLICQCGPERVLGEQVAGRDGLGWLDLVSADLEGLGYACGAVPAPSAGFGAPHIRERLYWLADAKRHGPEAGLSAQAGRYCGDTAISRDGGNRRPRPDEGRPEAGGLADGHGKRCEEARHRGVSGQWPERAERNSGDRRPGPVNGFWRNADWLGCRDGKWRPVEPGTFPLAHGVPARVVRLRGYGNAINAEHAAAFVTAAFALQVAA